MLLYLLITYINGANDFKNHLKTGTPELNIFCYKTWIIPKPVFFSNLSLFSNHNFIPYSNCINV